MIIETLLRYFAEFTEWLVGLLPAVPSTWTLDITNGAGQVGGILGLVNEAVPVDTLGLVVGIYLAIYAGIHAANAIRRMISLGTGGGGA